MEEIKIDIHLTVSEEKIKMLCEANQCNREKIVDIIINCLKLDMTSTIEANEELWKEKTFEVK